MAINEEFLRDHRHQGTDYPKIDYNDLVNLPTISSGITGKLTMGGVQSINDSSETLVAFDTSGFTAVGITVDTTNKKMTILTVGKYLITAKLTYSATVDLKSYQLRIKKNGSQIGIDWITSSVASGTHYITTIISNVFDLAVDDYIEIYAYQLSGVAQIIGAVGSEYFTITKVV